MIVRVVQLSNNRGLGIARNIGVQLSSFNYIAVMDSDDVCDKRRFEKQMYVITSRKIDVLGGQILEFSDKHSTIYYRNVPLSDLEIKRYLKVKCPFNHMTVLFNKKALEACGGYKHFLYNEDYYLWLRLFLNNASFANLPDVLVKARFGPSDVKRRRGLTYFKSEIAIQKFMLENNVINRLTYLKNIFKRFIGEMVIAFVLPTFFLKISHGKKNRYLLEETCVPKDAAKKLPPFTLVMSIYRNDNIKYFNECLDSILNQSLMPEEIIIVVDGKVDPLLIDVIYSHFSNTILEKYE